MLLWRGSGEMIVKLYRDGGADMTEIRVAENKILQGMRNRTAQEILEEYAEDGKVPVDIVKVAQNIGIVLGSIDFTDLEKSEAFRDITKDENHILGAVFTDGDEVQIVYQNKLHESSVLKNLSTVDKEEKLFRRQRFTIAHEIAHCCLGLEDLNHIEFRTDQKTYEEGKERDANIFAGELLIPEKSLIAICSVLGKVVSISFLADLFKVSKNVMEARIEYLKAKGFFSELKYI